ncbi:MAG: hypothetical protein CL813_02820 [Confluentimicrobium sp.]|nr:hypothetical protein [Actibacterium sp.]MBF51875.1 hypothetical protein [Actibacterium sp.]
MIIAMQLQFVHNHHDRLTLRLRHHPARRPTRPRHQRRLLAAIGFVLLTFLVSVVAHLALTVLNIAVG